MADKKVPNLKAKYQAEVAPALMQKFGYKSVMQIPKIDKVVVNVGCGLDTRFQRIGGGKAVFFDMDLPEVIALRRELIPEQPGNAYIAASLLETGWMDDLLRRHPDA